MKYFVMSVFMLTTHVYVGYYVVVPIYQGAFSWWTIPVLLLLGKACNIKYKKTRASESFFNFVEREAALVFTEWMNNTTCIWFSFHILRGNEAFQMHQHDIQR